MRILLTGAQGMLGQDVLRILGPSHHVVGVDQDEADITDLSAICTLIQDVRPELVLHAAAFTEVDRAESCPEVARRVNALGTLHVCIGALQVEAAVAYISTDYVFDGTKGEPYVETDRPNPLSVYGSTKYAGERVVQSMFRNYYIFRTSWLFASHGKNFVNTISRLAREKGELAVVDDQVGTPTYSCDLAHAINTILAHGAPGLYHVANAEPCSWFEFAGAILAQQGIEAKLEPTTTARFRRPAPRPACSALATPRLHNELGYDMRSWREALADCLAIKKTMARPNPTHPRATVASGG